MYSLSISGGVNYRVLLWSVVSAKRVQFSCGSFPTRREAPIFKADGRFSTQWDDTFIAHT